METDEVCLECSTTYCLAYEENQHLLDIFDPQMEEHEITIHEDYSKFFDPKVSFEFPTECDKAFPPNPEDIPLFHLLDILLNNVVDELTKFSPSFCCLSSFFTKNWFGYSDHRVPIHIVEILQNPIPKEKDDSIPFHVIDMFERNFRSIFYLLQSRLYRARWIANSLMKRFMTPILPMDNIYRVPLIFHIILGGNYFPIHPGFLRVIQFKSNQLFPITYEMEFFKHGEFSVPVFHTSTPTKYYDGYIEYVIDNFFFLVEELKQMQEVYRFTMSLRSSLGIIYCLSGCVIYYDRSGRFIPQKTTVGFVTRMILKHRLVHDMAYSLKEIIPKTENPFEQTSLFFYKFKEYLQQTGKNSIFRKVSNHFHLYNASTLL